MFPKYMTHYNLRSVQPFSLEVQRTMPFTGRREAQESPEVGGRGSLRVF